MFTLEDVQEMKELAEKLKQGLTSSTQRVHRSDDPAHKAVRYGIGEALDGIHHCLEGLEEAEQTLHRLEPSEK